MARRPRSASKDRKQQRERSFWSLPLFFFLLLIVVVATLYIQLESTSSATEEYNHDNKDASNIASTAVKSHGSETYGQVFKRILDRLHRQTYTCKHPLSLGGIDMGNGDGVWTVCADFWKLDKPTIKDAYKHSNITDCIVYSFGVAYDFSFDEEMARKNCIVYSFDPSTINLPERMVLDSGVVYLREGIGAIAQDDYIGSGMLTGGQQKWKMDTLPGFMKRLGHDHLTVLKIDIEYGEWDVLDTLLSKDSAVLDKVEQLVFEVHFWVGTRSKGTELEEAKRWARVIEGIEAKGFKNFNIHTNPQGNTVMLPGVSKDGVSCCYEVSFVKIK